MKLLSVLFKSSAVFGLCLLFGNSEFYLELSRSFPISSGPCVCIYMALRQLDAFFYFLLSNILP